MTDFTWRQDEWEIGGDMLLADLEITLNWDWRNGEPHNFTATDCQRFDAMNRRGVTAPVWMQGAMMTWVAENQAKLLTLWREHDLNEEPDADDIAWSHQLRSTLPSVATHL